MNLLPFAFFLTMATLLWSSWAIYSLSNKGDVRWVFPVLIGVIVTVIVIAQFHYE